MAASVTTPPYMPFKTLLALIERMGNDGVPPQIDRSYLTGSGAANTQFIAGLKALGLIAENNVVQQRLVDLATAEPQGRPRLMLDILHEYYPRVNELGPVNGTQAQLESAFATHHNATGVTRRKAIAFYLAAARFAGLPLSKNFKNLRASPGVATGGAGSTPAPKRAKPKGKRVKRPGSNGGGEAPVLAPPVDTLKAKYFEMLMGKAEGAEGTPDEELLNRIERLLGIGAEGPEDQE